MLNYEDETKSIANQFFCCLMSHFTTCPDRDPLSAAQHAHDAALRRICAVPDGGRWAHFRWQAYKASRRTQANIEYAWPLRASSLTDTRRQLSGPAATRSKSCTQ
jgi:hypothetical protein